MLAVPEEYGLTADRYGKFMACGTMRDFLTIHRSMNGVTSMSYSPETFGSRKDGRALELSPLGRSALELWDPNVA